MDHYNPAQAPAEIEYDPAAGVARIRYEGPVDAAGLFAAHEALHACVAGRAMIGLVIDVRDSDPAYNASELLEAMETCVAEWPLERVALISRTDRERLLMIMETVGFPQGVRVRAFAQADEARRFAAGL